MKTIVLATNNNNKVIEFTDFFEKYFPGKYSIKTQKQVGFFEDIVESGETFEENAYIKANTVMKATGLVSIADDSGLEVDILGGRPGVFSARYAGEGCSSEDNINKLLQELDGTPLEKRTARFVCNICACYPDGRVVKATGKCEGIILDRKKGSGVFGYDPVFYFPPLSKTFAQLDIDIKNTVSHRGKALFKFADNFKLYKA